MKKLLLCLCIFLTLLTLNVSAQQDKMDWWKDAKFGLFIHWGVYSIPAGSWEGKPVPGIGEWIMNKGKIPVADYQKLPSQFNPVKFNADEWVKLAKEAGMRYIVITSKHHDGFAMFKSNASSFNIVDATPFKRDVIQELATACKKYNIKFGLYYSQAQDWNHPGGAANGGNWDSKQSGNMDKYLDEVAVPQVKEILTAYNPAIIWWDTPTGMTEERAAKFTPLLKQYPNIIFNNRLGGGVAGDLETPEQYIPATGIPGKNWESCMTMNNTWGFKADDQNWKSTELLVRNLIDIASKGGNYLLNVGPTSEGIIPQPSVERLQQMGAWLKVNGESIYGVTASPFAYLSWGRATVKNNKLFLHVFDWPADGKIKLPLQNSITNAYLLANKKSIVVKKESDHYVLQLPTQPLDKIATVIVIEAKGEIKSTIAEPIPSNGKSATASSQLNDKTQATNVLDNDNQTVWKPAQGQTSGWIEVDLGKPYSIGAFFANETGAATTEYQYAYKEGNEWKVIASGKTIGNGQLKKFTPVVAQYFRLNIISASKEPIIKSIQLFYEE
jgi:alpha-L-fucosidase